MKQYVVTETQLEALNQLPPGVYVVCAQCKHFHPSVNEFYFTNGEPICEFCHRWGRCLA